MYFHSNNGYVNMPHCYIICMLHILLWIIQHARFYCTDYWIISTSNLVTCCMYMQCTKVNIYQLHPVQVLLLFPLVLLLPCARRWAIAGGNGSREDVGCYNRFYLPAHLIYSIGSHELYFFSGIPWGTLVDLYLIIMKWVILDTVGMILSRFIYKSLLNIRYMVLFILMAAP